jgi:hypothetical protein
MDIFEIQKAYRDGSLPKHEFVDAMHKHHQILEKYARYIRRHGN